VAISELRYPGKLATLAFSPEGAVLLAGGGNGLRGFLVSGVDLMQEACSRVSRNLTVAEWQRDVGARACRSTLSGPARVRMMHYDCGSTLMARSHRVCPSRFRPVLL